MARATNGERPISPEQKRQLDQYLEQHAPYGWIDRDEARQELLRLIHPATDATQNLVPVLVLSADIRKSTILMRESVNLIYFAETLGDFTRSAQDTVRKAGGWFDKFTGDGFLAYWLPEFEEPLEPGDQHRDEDENLLEEWLLDTSGRAAGVASALMDTFFRETLPQFAANCQNFPADAGLSIGIDGGLAQVVVMADELTIVGKPVVGSVRMVSCARSWEALANVYVGELLSRAERYTDMHLPPEIRSVGTEVAGTKEYEEQLVYPIEFVHFRPPTRPPTRASAATGPRAGQTALGATHSY